MSYKVLELEAMPGWTWNAIETAYREGMAALKLYAEREGHTKIPLRHIEAGFNMGYWVSRRRKEYGEGKLTQEKVRELEAVPGWTWDAKK